MVRTRVAELKARGVTQTEIAVKAGKPEAQSMISAVANGLRRFNVEDLERWANGLEFTGPEREEFLRLGREASYFLVPSEATLGESAEGLKIWRELLSLRAEIFATRSQLLRSQAQLADANGRVVSLEKQAQLLDEQRVTLEKQVELLIQRRKAAPKRGDSEA